MGFPSAASPQQPSGEPDQAEPQGGRDIALWLAWWDTCLQGSCGATFLRPCWVQRAVGSGPPQASGVCACACLSSPTCAVNKDLSTSLED